jgi:hypothetical protein
MARYYKFVGHGAIHVDVDCPGARHRKNARDWLDDAKLKIALAKKGHRGCRRCNPEMKGTKK